jgi:hypothetical protein
MPNVCETLETGIVGFTFDDAYEVIRNSKERVSAPKNESRSATISGPISGSEKYNPDIKDLF